MSAAKNGAVVVKRKTAESEIVFTLDAGARNPDLKKEIRTPLQFFNHMLETVAWRACVNIGVASELSDYKLTHVICEDIGLCCGEAFLKLFDKMTSGGINGSGSAVSCIDEALAECSVSFEGRSLLVIDEKLTGGPELVEDMQAADLVSFLEGFVQGARATLHVVLPRGVNPHHVWEAVFRAIGEALRVTFGPCPWRAGTTPGVKGKVELSAE